MHQYQLTATEILQQLHSTDHGLSSIEAQQRLSQYGPNMLQEKKKISPWIILLSQFTSPLTIILIIATLISMAIGHMIDGVIIMIIVVLNAIFGFIQEYKAEKSMESLKKMMSLKSKVLRDGSLLSLDSTELVP